MRKKLIIAIILAIIVPGFFIWREMSNQLPSGPHCQANCSFPVPDQSKFNFEAGSQDGWKNYSNTVGYSIEFPNNYIAKSSSETFYLYNNTNAWNFYNQDVRSFETPRPISESDLQIEFIYSVFGDKASGSIKDFAFKQRVNEKEVFNYVFYNNDKIFNIYCYNSKMFQECKRIISTFKFIE